MSNQKGKKYWQKRKKIGRPKEFSTPEELWNEFCAYCAEVDENPIKKAEIIKSGFMAGTTFEVPLARPYNWDGFEDWIFEKRGFVKFNDYKSNKDGRYEDYAWVIERIKKVMRTQKFEGAAAGLFNPNIIAYDLGLAAKQIIETKGETSVDPSKLSKEALEEIAAQSKHKSA